MTTWTRDEVVQFIKQDLLLDRLDLAGSGATLAEIADDTPLIGSGLSLDSVDLLDLLVGVERKFSLTLPELTSAFVQTTCKTVGVLADYVCAELAQPDLTTSAA